MIKIYNLAIVFAISLVVACGIYFYLKISEKRNLDGADKECYGDQLENCDKSCSTAEDCAPAEDCDCYNKKDAGKIMYSKDGSAILWMICGPSIGDRCYCINNKCVREVSE